MATSDVSGNLRTGAEHAQPSTRAPGIADPVPVGIAGFAMTTFILSCVNAGFFGRTELGVATSSLLPIGGYVGITCGVAAWYVAFAHVANATFGRELIPTWPLN
jgi:succinate-acetate transporter protein